MTIFYGILMGIGAIIVLRNVLLLFSAEMGRKHDLIKHIYKSATDFHLAIIIPYLDASKIGAFQELIQALAKQDYPTSHIGIHVITTEESGFGLPDAEALPVPVKYWTHPNKQINKGHAIGWVIDRLLAMAGPSRLFVFLEADDIVRPDFLRNVTTKAYDCYVMQGYVALKRPPQGLVATIAALSIRLMNRIENAGRYHLGLSCQLQNSGWIIRQEILEMLAFQQGQDMDNAEYTAILNLQGYRIHWAPNVVVYKEERVNGLGRLLETAQSTLNRIRLSTQYGLPLVLHSITNAKLSSLDQAWTLIKPPNFVIGLLGMLGIAALGLYPLFYGSFYYWGILTLAFLSTQLLALAVARCSFKDVLMAILVTPAVYIMGLVLFPFVLVMALFQSLFYQGGQDRRARIGKRFDESQPIATPPHQFSSFAHFEDDDDLPVLKPTRRAESDWKQQSQSDTENFAAIYGAAERQAETSEPDENGQYRWPQTVLLPISNGKHTVNCTLHTHTVPQGEGNPPLYYLAMEYKTLTFTTQQYRLVDQAYYELQSKLQTKGFSIVSCGSCAQFFHPTPTANIPGVTPSHGICLFGKSTDTLYDPNLSITVLSPLCPEYTDISQRDVVMSQFTDLFGATV